MHHAQGTAAEQDVMVKRLRHMLGDLTFMEAFHHTGADLCLDPSFWGWCLVFRPGL